MMTSSKTSMLSNCLKWLHHFKSIGLSFGTAILLKMNILMIPGKNSSNPFDTAFHLRRPLQFVGMILRSFPKPFIDLKALQGSWH